MRVRLIAAGIAVLTALGQAGCASIAQLIAPRPVAENPLIVPSADFETVWKASVAVLDEYFDIATENRLSRTIITQPKIGATVLEPWSGDSPGLYDRLESSLQTIRRHGRITINPAPGGGFAVKVEVFKELEDLAKPDRQAAGRAVFNNDFPVNRTREIVGPVPVPLQWIPRGRDAKLEQEILDRLRDALFL
ncbi:MAG TPA: hypothetical protein VKP69_24060 [Isosphaeraceae bacterium]|nr:hypothetical protein [Isosphaeraceae bacterium]